MEKIKRQQKSKTPNRMSPLTLYWELYSAGVLTVANDTTSIFHTLFVDSLNEFVLGGNEYINTIWQQQNQTVNELILFNLQVLLTPALQGKKKSL